MQINRQQLLAMFDDDPEILEDVTKAFLGAYPEYFAELKKACADSEAKAVEAAAHRLKGAIACFGLEQLATALQHIESAARESQQVPSEPDVAKLETMLNSLVNDLKEVLAP